MSGLVTQTRQKGSASGLSQGFTFQRFTTAGSTTIAKPYGCSIIVIECIGGGGGECGAGGRRVGRGHAPVTARVTPHTEETLRDYLRARHRKRARALRGPAN